MFRRRWKHLRDEKGGVFFKDRTGEHVFVDSARIWTRHLEKALRGEAKTIEEFLESFGPTDSQQKVLGDSLKGGEGNPVPGYSVRSALKRWISDSDQLGHSPEDGDENPVSVKSVRGPLESWISGQTNPSWKECLPLLTLMREVLLFESNRPFDKVWYGQERQPDKETLCKLWEKFTPLTSSDEIYTKYCRELQTNLKKYLGSLSDTELQLKIFNDAEETTN